MAMQVEYQNGMNNGGCRKLSPMLSETSTGNSSRKSSNGTIKPVKEQILYDGKSIQLSEYTFEDGHGKEKSAEIIRKRYMVGSARSGSETDTILSIAILKRHILCDCLILVKQYRPTLKSYVLEFPARIIEQRENERSGDYAVKDLETNTGYGSTVVKHISPETAMDPDLCDSKLKLVSLIIDGDDPIKNNFFQAKQSKKRKNSRNSLNTSSEEDDDELDDDDDDIEVIPVPVNGLLDRLNEYCKRGIIVDSRVYAFAIGLKKGEKLSQKSKNPENIEIAI